MIKEKLNKIEDTVIQMVHDMGLRDGEAGNAVRSVMAPIRAGLIESAKHHIPPELINSEGLDEAISDIFAEKASEVNNSGFDGQLEYLLFEAGWTANEILIEITKRD